MSVDEKNLMLREELVKALLDRWHPLPDTRGSTFGTGLWTCLCCRYL